MERIEILNKKREELKEELNKINSMLELNTDSVSFSAHIGGALSVDRYSSNEIPKDDVKKILDWLKELYGDEDKPYKEASAFPPVARR